MTADDDLSPRARWFLENFSELDLAEICADQEARLKANIVTLNTDREKTRRGPCLCGRQPDPGICSGGCASGMRPDGHCRCACKAAAPTGQPPDTP